MNAQPDAKAMSSPGTSVAPSNGTLVRRILALAAPTAFLTVLQVFTQLFETWLASRQGTAALAGWAVVLPFALVMQQMSAGAMGGGVVSAIARTLGARRTDEASALVLHAVTIAVTAGAMFAIVLGILATPVFTAVAGEAAAKAAIPYATWLFCGAAVSTWLANTLASVMRGGGRHAAAARILSFSGIAYPMLAFLIMEPLGAGLPGLGMAMSLTMTAAALAMGAMVLGGKAGFTPDLRVPYEGKLFSRILSVGLVASALSSIANLTTILVTRQVASYGIAAVAAYGVSARIEFLMIPLVFGIGSALTALVGNAAGAGDWRTARRTAWLGAALTLALVGPVAIAVTLLPRFVADAFTSDPAVAAIATRALGYVGPALVGFGLGMSLYFASIGAGRMLGPVTAAVARIAIAAGGGFVLANFFGMGLDGYFLAVALGITAYGALTAAGVRASVWRLR